MWESIVVLFDADLNIQARFDTQHEIGVVIQAYRSNLINLKIHSSHLIVVLPEGESESANFCCSPATKQPSTAKSHSVMNSGFETKKDETITQERLKEDLTALRDTFYIEQ